MPEVCNRAQLFYAVGTITTSTTFNLTVFVVEVVTVPHCTKEMGAVAYHRHRGAMSRAVAGKTPRTASTLLQGKSAEQNISTESGFFAVEGIF